MIGRLTSSSHCRCLSRLAMSSGVSPASLAKTHTQKHIWRGGYKPGWIRTSFAFSHHILYSWLPVLNFILQTRQSQVYPDSLFTIDAGRDLREEIPWHRFILPHTYTSRTACVSLLPIVGGQIVNSRTATELQTHATLTSSPSSQNKYMLWEHPEKWHQTKQGVSVSLKTSWKGKCQYVTPKLPVSAGTTSGDFIRCIPMSIEAFPLSSSLRHSLLSVRQQ